VAVFNVVVYVFEILCIMNVKFNFYYCNVKMFYIFHFYYYYYYMIYIAPISRIESEALASLGGEHD